MAKTAFCQSCFVQDSVLIQEKWELSALLNNSDGAIAINRSSNIII